MSQRDYTKPFHDGLPVAYTVQADDGPLHEQYTLHLRTIGELIVTSGHLVACDPLALPDTQPLADTIPPGRYPVLLSIAERSKGDQRVAYAMLRLHEYPAVRWELATPQGKTLDSLQPGYVFGYPVDAGTGCFMDIDAERGLLDPSTGETNGDKLLDQLDQTSVHTWSWADLIIDATTGANVIAFSSGWGDGFYSSYWGFDATGERVALVTDFEVIDDSWIAS